MAFARSRRRGRSRPVVLLLVLLAITLLTLDARGWGPIRSARRAAGDLLSPVTRAASKVFQPVENAWNGAFGYSKLKSENEKLRQQVADLKGKEAQAEAVQGQMGKLAGLLNLPWVGDIPTITAEVVALPPSNFDETIQIDKGSADGVLVGYPVVDGAGLVGRVSAVGRHRAVIRLITDPDSFVGVELPAVPERGIADGHGRGELLTIDLVGVDATVPVGTVVATTGVPQSLFPAHIPVGTVTEVRRGSGDLQLTVRVTPIADLESLSVLRVLKWKQES